MSEGKPAFVLVHGYWHNSGCWSEVVPRLQARGFEVATLDLPGAGVNAKLPASFLKRPLDPAAFAVEPSPNAAVTQEQRTQAVIDLIRSLGRPVVLVGHSMGGATISDVVEAAPESIAAVVYLTAFLLAPGAPPISVITHETMAAAIVPSLFAADPAVVGALRIDPRSADPDYRARLKDCFYGDVSDEVVAEIAPTLHCDEPMSTALRPSAVTAARFGTVPRHYIRCAEDHAITLAGQNHMLALADSALGGETIVHTLQASHSPFLSQPDELTDLLASVAG